MVIFLYLIDSNILTTFYLFMLKIQAKFLSPVFNLSRYPIIRFCKLTWQLIRFEFRELEEIIRV